MRAALSEEDRGPLFKAFTFDYAKVLIILNNVPTISPKAYGNLGRGVFYCNFAGQGCYRETIYSLLAAEE
jgi:hypothetical protein